MLGIEDDATSLLDAPAHRVGDHREVLLDRRAQHVDDLAIPGLADQRDDRRHRADERAHLQVVLRPHPRASRRAERRQRRGVQRMGAHRLEELGVGGIRARPSALDDGDSERVEMLGDAQLVGHREVDADALGAVAQRGVVDLDAHDADPTRAQRAHRLARHRVGDCVGARRAAEVGREHVLADADVDRCLDGERKVVAVQRVPEQHRDREDRSVRVGDALPGEARRAAVNRFVQTLVGRAEARRRQQSERAGEHGRLVTEDVAEEVLGDHDVDRRRLAHHAHREGVDELVRERHRRILGRESGHHLAPELAGDEHVRLVDGDELAAA